MGLHPDVFWAMSPEEFEAAARGWQAEKEEQRRYEDWRLGRVTAIYLNANRDPSKHPEQFTASDVFPHLRDPNEPEPRAEGEEIDEDNSEVTEEELEAQLRAMKGLD